MTEQPNVSAFDLPIHPAAEAFPLLDDDELAELAADIAQNGQRRPIVVAALPDENGNLIDTLLDGRNRLRACELAGVEPVVERVEVEDPRAFIVSENIRRRHQTAGQRAMSLACIYPTVEHGGDRRSSAKAVSSFMVKLETDVSSAAISKARTVLRDAPTLVPLVLKGSMALAEAYKEARAAQQRADSRDERIAKIAERHPDLAQMVREESIGIEAGETEARERDQRARAARESLFLKLRDVRERMMGFAASTELPRLPEYLATDETREEFLAIFQDDPAALHDMVERARVELEALEQVIAKIEQGEAK